MNPRADPTRWPALDVDARRARLQRTERPFDPGPLAAAIDRDRDAANQAIQGLWARDAATWSSDAAARQHILNRLGWLTSPALMADTLGRLREFAAGIQRDHFTDVVLLGMGGSSLAPEVLRAVLGSAPGWPRLHVLDSTDPDAVLAASTPPARTLYLLASKSGTTIEPNVLASHFRAQLESADVSRWADHFVAITDDDTALARRARSEGFRDIFINPTDIGGRYSALSYFGLVPAALMGQDLSALVGWGLAMLSACGPDNDGSVNPGAALGLAMATAAREGRDKLTLILPAALQPIGLWVEQLVAESTGKQGVGVIPIAAERLATPDKYGTDRLFVRVRVHGSYAESGTDGDIRDLKHAGHPVAEIELLEPAAIGAEFVRWEVATAVAGALLQINPFDEPNVQQAKDATRKLLDGYKSTGKLPATAADTTLPAGTALTLGATARAALAGRNADAFLTLIGPGDYFGVLGYVGPDPALAEEIRALLLAVRDRTRAATMFGYGPRYLHSTGQLHKGGPPTGVFAIVTAAHATDLPIPGEPFSFETLELAQALGDFDSLDAAGRRVVRIHLPAPDARLMREAGAAMLSRLV
jgi:glucose-6-phosphate isomerase